MLGVWVLVSALMEGSDESEGCRQPEPCPVRQGGVAGWILGISDMQS